MGVILKESKQPRNAMITATLNQSKIARHLNVIDSAIIEVQEWATVLWVRFKGGCKFVSKKIMNSNNSNGFSAIPGKLVSEDLTSAVKKALYWKEKGKSALYDKQIANLIKWQNEDIAKNSGLGMPLAKQVEDQEKAYIRSFLDFEKVHY